MNFDTAYQSLIIILAHKHMLIPELFVLLCLNILILVIGVEKLELKFHIGSKWLIATPMILTYLMIHLMMSIAIRISRITLRSRYIALVCVCIGILELGTGFAINTTIIPGSKSIKGGEFRADPLIPCKVETGCPQLFQSRFRFQWLQGAADVMVNGISKQLSVNWGDVVDGARVVMVATTDNDTGVNYKLVESKKESIPAFSVTTLCNQNTHFPDSSNFYNLSISTPTPLIQAIQADSGLEGRWMAEVINLEQDNILETTRITVNLVQISVANSSCEGSIDIVGKLQLCHPTKGLNVVCLMNTHVEYVDYITAGCDTCNTRGITNINRVEYSSPKPVYGDFMHTALALYGGHILIPQCSSDNSVGGCLTQNDKNVDQVRDQFVQLLRGITASGVIARRVLLADVGIEMPVQNLDKGVIGEKLEFGMGYWVTLNLAFVLMILLGIYELIIGWLNTNLEPLFEIIIQI
ncbi:13366_t:CDS:1 [Funneliformis caledonium]|uniref:13366_t:CDS:1 n=1 Tax=Funneliformis caledonium TaxID=1117310 RepID=A0A9N9BS57_9GLOM|nr:13366_t:CDS:1 [Funneliformis caledonium]